MNYLLKAFNDYLNAPYELTPGPYILLHPRHKFHEPQLRILVTRNKKKISAKNCPLKNQCIEYRELTEERK